MGYAYKVHTTIALDKRIFEYKIVIIFLSISLKICFGCSLRWFFLVPITYRKIFLITCSYLEVCMTHRRLYRQRNKVKSYKFEVLRTRGSNCPLSVYEVKDNSHKWFSPSTFKHLVQILFGLFKFVIVFCLFLLPY